MCIALVETCSRGNPRPFDVQVKGGGPMEKHASLKFPFWRISTTIRATYIQPFLLVGPKKTIQFSLKLILVTSAIIHG